MLSLLHKKHSQQVAAIVASGPSASLYKGDEELSIAVNGAAYLRQDFDYFLCGDNNSHTFDWFNIKCSTVRVIAKLVASMDYQLYPTDFDKVIERKAVPAHKQRQVNGLLCPIYPNIVFNYRWYSDAKLKPDNNFLMFGGTISCCAVQLAYMMQCSEIHLYGCNFTHKQQHYFYENKGRHGVTSNSQFETMERCLAAVRKNGMKVYIHGSSKLTQCDEKII